MAEVVGLVASIITVTGTGLALSRALRETICEFRSAASHVQDLATSVTNFSNALRQIGNCIKEKNSPHTEEALVTVRQVVEHCKAIFTDLHHKIDAFNGRGKGPDGSLNSRDKLRWYFKKSSVRYLTSRLDSEKATLTLLLQILQLRSVMNDSRRQTESDNTLSTQVTELRDLVQELLLDRVWARQKEEASRATGTNSPGPSTSNNETDSTTEPSNNGSESSDSDDDDNDDRELYSRKDSDAAKTEAIPTSDHGALVIYSATLERLDKALPVNETIIPSTVIARSTKAIEFLLSKWSASLNESEGEGTTPEGPFESTAHENLEDPPTGVDLYRYFCKETSFLSQVSPHIPQIYSIQQPSSYITSTVLRRNCGFVPRLLDRLPSGKDKFLMPEDVKAVYEKIRAGNNNRCWSVADGPYTMYFMGELYIGTDIDNSNDTYHDEKWTILPDAWFEEATISGRRPGDWRISNSGDHWKSPLCGENAYQLTDFMLIGIWSIEQISLLGIRSGSKRSLEQHLIHLGLFRLFEAVVQSEYKTYPPVLEQNIKGSSNFSGPADSSVVWDGEGPRIIPIHPHGRSSRTKERELSPHPPRNEELSPHKRSSSRNIPVRAQTFNDATPRTTPVRAQTFNDSTPPTSRTAPLPGMRSPSSRLFAAPDYGRDQRVYREHRDEYPYDRRSGRSGLNHPTLSRGKTYRDDGETGYRAPHIDPEPQIDSHGESLGFSGRR